MINIYPGILQLWGRVGSARNSGAEWTQHATVGQSGHSTQQWGKVSAERNSGAEWIQQAAVRLFGPHGVPDVRGAWPSGPRYRHGAHAAGAISPRPCSQPTPRVPV